MKKAVKNYFYFDLRFINVVHSSERGKGVETVFTVFVIGQVKIRERDLRTLFL